MLWLKQNKLSRSAIPKNTLIDLKSRSAACPRVTIPALWTAENSGGGVRGFEMRVEGSHEGRRRGGMRFYLACLVDIAIRRAADVRVHEENTQIRLDCYLLL